MKIINHLLDSAEQIPSPNYNERPADSTLELLVIHNISLPPGEFGGPFIRELFTNTLNCQAHPYFAQLQDFKVAAHAVIYRTGLIQQFVAFNKRAWHAGESSYQGKKNCNDFSIGIELEGTDELAYTNIQYEKLTCLINALLSTYPSVSPQHIVGHCDIAPGRKTDPGKSFDWVRLQNNLQIKE